MPALTIPQVFGTGATVSGGNLTIPLSGLASTGLSNSTPTASELLTAIILQLVSSQTAASQEDITVGVFVGDPFLTIARGGVQLERQFPVSVFTPFASATLDPDEVIG